MTHSYELITSNGTLGLCSPFSLTSLFMSSFHESQVSLSPFIKSPPSVNIKTKI